jgi:hypothetical protein
LALASMSTALLPPCDGSLLRAPEGVQSEDAAIIKCGEALNSPQGLGRNRGVVMLNNEPQGLCRRIRLASRTQRRKCGLGRCWPPISGRDARRVRRRARAARRSPPGARPRHLGSRR